MMTVSVEESDDVDGSEGVFITSSRKEAIYSSCFLLEVISSLFI
jgi:hypothetical protein